MPPKQPPAKKPNGHTRKTVKHQRKRPAYWADQYRRAGNNPDKQVKVATRHAEAIAYHAIETRPQQGKRAVRKLANEVTNQARTLANEAGAKQASINHYETELDRLGDLSEVARLSKACQWLRCLIEELPDGRRERTQGDYVEQLNEAARTSLAKLAEAP